MSYIDSSVSVQPDAASSFCQATSWQASQAYDDREGARRLAELASRPAENLRDCRQAPERWTGLQARIACDRQTQIDAYRLRHLCYATKGHIDVRDNGLFSDQYDSEAGNTTIVIYDGTQPIGSVRVCTMTSPLQPGVACDLPVAHVFPAEMETLLPPRQRAAEINRLVSHPDHAHSLGLVFILLRMADYLIRKSRPDIVTFCVRSNHVPFYKRLQFEQVAGPRLYTGLKFMTTLMVVQQERFELVRRKIPVLNVTPDVLDSYDAMWGGQQVAVLGDE